jgi:hypothetical protein
MHVVPLGTGLEDDVLLLMGRRHDAQTTSEVVWDVRIQVATYPEGQKAPRAVSEPENEEFLAPIILD